jgi:tetratricopeptide (TPR) repeat protein
MKFKRVSRQFTLLVATILLIFGLGAVFSNLPDSWVVGDSKNYDEFARSPSFIRELESEPDELTISQKEQEKAQAMPLIDAKDNPQLHEAQQRELMITQLFDNAISLYQVGHFQQAVVELHKLLKFSPFMVEAHVNLGFSFLALEQLQPAANAFSYALELNEYQANAYYGLALIAEQEQDYQTALGAMRTYLHLRSDDQYIAKARAAIDTWQSIIEAQQANQKSSN